MQEPQVWSMGEDPLEKGNGYPLQYFCLENSMDRGAEADILQHILLTVTQNKLWDKAQILSNKAQRYGGFMLRCLV